MRPNPMLRHFSTLFRYRLFGAITLLPLLTLSLHARAQGDGEPAQGPEERWYQVEVIVFSRPGGDTGEEFWPRDLILNYPFDLVTLRDPSDPVSASARGRRGDPLALANGEADLARAPYYRLPQSERSLNNYVGALRRQGGYRVLFHQAWRQPFVEDATGPAILVSGGDAYGEHFELEGSLRLSLSRYLHLDTDLWLTRFVPNQGQAPGTWPQLPSRPSEDDDAVADLARATPLDAGYGDAWDLNLNGGARLPEFLREPYLPNRIVTMAQQRKMRSNELHYLDHPLMGMIIEITPYELPESAVR